MPGGDNAFQPGGILMNMASGATSMTLDTFGSNDLQVWNSFGTQYSVTAVGPMNLSARTAVTYKWIRFKIASVGAGGVVVFALDVSTSAL
jgi:hypothetical protein